MAAPGAACVGSVLSSAKSCATVSCFGKPRPGVGLPADSTDPGQLGRGQ